MSDDKIECGSGVFSPRSHLVVEKRVWRWPGPTSSIVAETWPFRSGTSERVRYELDERNHAEYVGETYRWNVVATRSEVDEASCPHKPNEPKQLNGCGQVVIYAMRGGRAYLIFNGVVTDPASTA